MKTVLTSRFVKLHDAKLQRDEQGLTMLAYALGAAIIVVPLAGLMFAFSNDTVSEAEAIVDAAVA
jgi:Flp pilus assembly pilin Flp